MPWWRRQPYTTFILGPLGFGALAGCEREAPADPECFLQPPTAAAPARPEPAVRVAEAGKGPGSSRRFQLSADTAFQLGDTPVVRLCGVRLVVFDSAGREIARLRSEHAEYDPRTEAVVARERVVVDVEDGRRLITEELHYAPREDRVWSPVRTTLQRPGLELHADSFTSDSQFETVRAFRARGTFQWDPGS